MVFSSVTEIQIVFKPFLMLITGQHLTSFEKRYIYRTLDYKITGRRSPMLFLGISFIYPRIRLTFLFWDENWILDPIRQTLVIAVA